ncbi:hypothetical protein PT974_03376 [Cladobotryum mycophilum]|uniref:Uncharacterized protein n=1 Tax=Cladobotryum mycophilum TaxID=491253 RepID=A0ABR0STB5_9HYPO
MSADQRLVTRDEQDYIRYALKDNTVYQYIGWMQLGLTLKEDKKKRRAVWLANQLIIIRRNAVQDYIAVYSLMKNILRSPTTAVERGIQDDITTLLCRLHGLSPRLDKDFGKLKGELLAIRADLAQRNPHRTEEHNVRAAGRIAELLRGIASTKDMVEAFVARWVRQLNPGGGGLVVRGECKDVRTYLTEDEKYDQDIEEDVCRTM